MTCPWCEDHETYQQLSQGNEAWQQVELATQMCRVEFDVADDGLKAAVWLGDSPETVFERHLNRHNIYLGRNSNRWQIMYSGAHEAFHRVCGAQKNAYHWAEEMFAVLFSLLYLERIGETAHAERNRSGLIEAAADLSKQQMLALDQKPLPDSLYGRAYLVGNELCQATGWENLKTLAALRTADGFPDLDQWLKRLPPNVRKKTLPILRYA